MVPGGSTSTTSGVRKTTGPTRSGPPTVANYQRLAALKKQYDPENLFRHNQNIKPTV